MSRTRMTALSLFAAFALSAVASGAAQAAGGPVWIHKGKTMLGETEKLALKSVNVGAFNLKSSLATIECKKEKNTGELIGSNPGTDKSTITFEECSVEGKTVAQCGAGKEGKIGPFEVKTLLGYPEGKTEGTEEAYDQFFPATSETVFVTFELSGTKCGLLNKEKVEVVATGTKVTEPKLESEVRDHRDRGQVYRRNLQQNHVRRRIRNGRPRIPDAGHHERGSLDRLHNSTKSHAAWKPKASSARKPNRSGR